VTGLYTERAGSQENIYFTAGANAQDSACGNKPEWAGNLCVTRAAGAVAGHNPARRTNSLPVRRVVSYTRHGDEAVVTETAAGKTRTTTTTHDAATRAISKAITSNEGRLVSYTDADGGTTATEFDRFGKQVKVSDPTGHHTYAYDRSAEPRGLLTSVTDSVAGTFSEPPARHRKPPQPSA
jgi:YD repeat-containing protein